MKKQTKEYQEICKECQFENGKHSQECSLFVEAKNPMTKVKKSPKHIIAEYVERKELIGLADYARALVEDSYTDREELIEKCWGYIVKAFREDKVIKKNEFIRYLKK